MKPDVAEKLSQAGDFHSLTRSVLALCEPFGAVHSFRIVHNRGAGRVACFVELESAKQQPALARALGTSAVNGAVCLDIPVGKDFGSQGKVVSLGFPPQQAAKAPKAAPQVTG
jgi:hypothetical protein